MGPLSPHWVHVPGVLNLVTMQEVVTR